MTGPVFIEYTKATKPSEGHPDGHLKGERYEVATPALARKWHPDAKIVSYADGSEVEEPASAKEESTPRTAPERGQS